MERTGPVIKSPFVDDWAYHHRKVTRNNTELVTLVHCYSDTIRNDGTSHMAEFGVFQARFACCPTVDIGADGSIPRYSGTNWECLISNEPFGFTVD